MNRVPQRELFSLFCRSISAAMGLHFPENQWQNLEKKLESALDDLPFSSVMEMISSFTTRPMQREHVEILASHLTVGETFFFRDEKYFEALQFQILPGLIRKRREEGNLFLRVWSAGCATGEEPYSLAILLRRTLPDIRNWNITILGTDINPRFLRKAEEGCYTKWSFRNTPPWVQDQYFEQRQDSRYHLREDIRRMVQFRYLNLAEDAYPNLLNNTNAMDVIFCRNVLMYFTPDLLQAVLERFHRSLVEKGWLIVSPVETPLAFNAGLKLKRFPGASLHQKEMPQSRMEAEIQENRQGKEQPAAIPFRPTTVVLKDLASINHAASGGRPAPDFNPDPATSRDGPSGKAGRPGTAGREEGSSENGDAGFREASKHYDTGRYGEAENLLKSLWESGAKSVPVGTLICRVHANQGRLDDAEAWCLETLKLEKTNARLYFILSTILEENGKPDDALGALKKALYIDPDFTLAHFALGNVLFRKKKPKESQKHFRNALKCLAGSKPDDIVPESEGITAGRFEEIIRSMMQIL